MWYNLSMSENSKKMGRPTDYTTDMPEMVAQYLLTYEDQDDVVPSIVGLCAYLNRARSTLYRWATEEGKEEFKDMLEAVNEAQERVALSGGLNNSMNSTIVKLLLAKHGYADKQDLAHTSPDGSMSPTKIEIVAASGNSKD